MAEPSNWNATFRGAEPSWANACVGNNGSPGYREYAEGFSDAANMLLAHVLDNEERSNVDILVYPICFNIRHAVELRLKHAIIKIKHLYEVKKINKVFDLVTIHDINKLWEIIINSCAELDRRFIIATEKIAEYVNDIGQIDPTGQNFRYPYSNDDVKHLTNESIINLFVIRKRFSKLSEYLSHFIDLIDCIITEYKQGLFTSKLSREDLFQITKIIPTYENWGSKEFTLAKKQITEKYNLSSNDFNRALKAIKNHREFSYLIKNKNQKIEISKETILNFFKYWIKINPQPNISQEGQAIINNKNNDDDIFDFDFPSKNHAALLKRIEFDEKIFDEYWMLHGCNLTNLDVAYLATFYSNSDFDYSERFFKTLNYELKITTNIPKENKINIKSLFHKFRYLEKTINNLLLLKEIEITIDLIVFLEIPPDKYQIAFFESGDNMPNISQHYQHKF